MEKVRTIEINESVFADNEQTAQQIRQRMTEQGTLFLNFMSSPGSGKTTLLTAVINKLKGEMKIGLMDVDIQSTLDAQRAQDNTGVRTLQIHNGGLCHIDADMTARALAEYDASGLDLMIMENIGNLVCPAEFDTGAHKNITILSVPEGDDKPLKYPLMYQVSDVVLINKIDTAAFFDFDFEERGRGPEQQDRHGRVLRFRFRSGGKTHPGPQSGCRDLPGKRKDRRGHRRLFRLDPQTG